MKMTTAALISMLALGSTAFAQNATPSNNAQAAADTHQTAPTEKIQVNRMSAIHSTVLGTTFTARALQNAALNGRNAMDVITLR